ncbi:DUF1376 domain-containing protein [Faucicola mancuniensis]|uniref:DUF1376 domain-containing protein n=1 Tax=Faucicola mancuniensis TaxID=1309795 RepID=UPI003977D144
MHFYNFNIKDYRAKTAHLTPIEHYIYRSLIDWYYLNEKPFDSVEQIKRWLMIDDETAIENVLSEFFHKRNGKYHHTRINKEVRNYQHKKQNDVTDDVTQNMNDVTHDVTHDVTQNNRTKALRNRNKIMINALKAVGENVNTRTKTAELQALCKKHDIDVTDDVTQNMNDVTHDVTQSVTELTAQTHAITNNHKPITNINNSLSNAGEQKKSADEVLAKAEQVKQANAQDIQDWNQPTLDEMRSMLFTAGFTGQLNQSDYDRHVSDMKIYYAEQAIIGKPLATNSLRKNKLRDWIIRDSQKNFTGKTHANNQSSFSNHAKQPTTAEYAKNLEAGLQRYIEQRRAERTINHGDWTDVHPMEAVV